LLPYNAATSEFSVFSLKTERITVIFDKNTVRGV